MPVEKIVEKTIEVPVEKEVIKEIYITDDEAVKKKLLSGFKLMLGSSICAPDWLIPCNIGSMADGKKFAENPPETPAKAAAMPARGCRPAA